MKKFDSDHCIFEVCKLSAPRPVFLNRQAILLLDYRQISHVSFQMLQQRNQLQLIRALLRNDDAQVLILEKIPSWFLPPDIHLARIDYIREPFFRQLLISACLQSIRDLLRRTRIRVPRDQGRNLMGIVDEYKVLKEDEVFIQYTSLDQLPSSSRRTCILENCKVVITKNPCHHPGDIRTFTAVNYPELAHLKDVVVFSQQGDRPAPHDISGSDLDGDEYLVIWHPDLVPLETDNAPPYDYDASIPSNELPHPVQREDINNKVLEIAELDCLGRLSNLHLAFADRFGVADDKPHGNGVRSTVALAGAISQEVDSGKTGYHPLSEKDIKKLNEALGNERPDYMDNANFEHYRSRHILGM
jgi:RNA-dependent RNA polymerase